MLRPSPRHAGGPHRGASTPVSVLLTISRWEKAGVRAVEAWSSGAGEASGVGTQGTDTRGEAADGFP